MKKEELRLYWSAYTDAFELIKHGNNISDSDIENAIKKNDFRISRIFCLAVRKEIKRIKQGGIPLDVKVYQKVFYDAWIMFKTYCEPNDTEEYWNGLVSNIRMLSESFGCTELVRDLLIHVTLDEIERILNLKK